MHLSPSVLRVTPSTRNPPPLRFRKIETRLHMPPTPFPLSFRVHPATLLLQLRRSRRRTPSALSKPLPSMNTPIMVGTFLTATHLWNSSLNIPTLTPESGATEVTPLQRCLTKVKLQFPVYRNLLKLTERTAQLLPHFMSPDLTL